MPTNKIIYGPGRIPKASEFAIGEIIINLDDSKVYSKNKQNIVFELVGDAGDGFKNAYLSSLFESGSLQSGSKSVQVASLATGISSSYSLDPAQMVNLNLQLSVGSTIKIVSGALSSFHSITSIATNGHSASFDPQYLNGNVNTGTTNEDIIKMQRNLSGSLLITSSTQNRDLIFSGSSGVVITTGSEPQSIEISIDGTSIAPLSDNIQGTLFTLNDTSGQTGINFSPDGDITSGNTISAVASGLGTDADVQFGTLSVGNLTSTGTVTFSGLDNVTTENHVLVFNDSNNEVDYIPTSSLIPVLQNSITTVIDPYGTADSDATGNDRVGGVDNNVTIAAGTSLEQILRDILIDYVGPEITTTLIRNTSNATVVPVVGGNHLEVGDGNLTDVDEFRISGTNDSNGTFFDVTDSITLTGNQNSNGTDNNTLANVDTNNFSGATNISFDAITLLRTSSGNVTFTATVSPTTDSSYDRTTSISLPFNHAVFCGARPDILYQTPTQDNFDNIIAHISGGGATTGIGCQNSRAAVNFTQQTILSYNTDGGITSALTEAPTPSLFPPINSNNSRGVKLKPRGDASSNGSDVHLTANWYIYFAYPSSYGELTHVILPSQASGFPGGELSIGGGAPFIRVPGTFNITRLGATYSYYIYQSTITNFITGTGNASGITFLIKT